MERYTAGGVLGLIPSSLHNKLIRTECIHILSVGCSCPVSIGYRLPNPTSRLWWSGPVGPETQGAAWLQTTELAALGLERTHRTWEQRIGGEHPLIILCICPWQGSPYARWLPQSFLVFSQTLSRCCGSTLAWAIWAETPFGNPGCVTYQLYVC